MLVKEEVEMFRMGFGLGGRMNGVRKDMRFWFRRVGRG